jgi:hypothetical protein
LQFSKKINVFRLKIALSIFVTLVKAGHGQTLADSSVLKKELAVIYERDQKTRKGDSSQFMKFIDSTNLVRVEAILAKYGWPGKSKIGNKGNYAIWLVIQHSDLQTQERYLPLMKASVEQQESEPDELAYLEDRILMRKGKSQIYGTQISINTKTGAQEIWPIDDEEHVDVRRSKLGLEPMELYAKHFGIEYKLPIITKYDKSTITCPKCGYKKLELLPTEICLLKYKCEKCGAILRPKEGDCCVYCTYGDYKCPSMQDRKR